MNRKISLVVALLSSVAALAAQLPEIRTHYLIAERGTRTPVYHATVISSSSETRSSETYLFEKVSGERLKIDIVKNFPSRQVIAEYSLNGAKPVKVRLQMPGTSTTRTEMMNEFRTNAALRTADIPVTLESNGQTVHTSEKAWKEGKDRDKAKAVIAPETLAAMKAVLPVLGTPAFGGACSTVSFVTGQQCAISTAFMIATYRPDCDFDAKHGAPCDDKQKLRAKAQPKDGKVGPY